MFKIPPNHQNACLNTRCVTTYTRFFLTRKKKVIDKELIEKYCL